VKLLVYGSKDFGRVLRDLLVICGHEFIGYIDDLNSGEEIVGNYTTATKLHPPGTCGIVIAIGYEHLAQRWGIFQRVSADGYFLPPLIHNRAYVRDPSAVGKGAVVMAGATVDVCARLADLVVLWPGATVSHDSVIGENTFISPNATVCGFVTVGRSCFIGAGAVVVDHRSVPDNSFIKAGQVFA
jgi:sugar O-acyltransferase (sialic acid O-acetyltransferase NeuD family)